MRIHLKAHCGKKIHIVPKLAGIESRKIEIIRTYMHIKRSFLNT